jgi:hypothetical protein
LGDRLKDLGKIIQKALMSKPVLEAAAKTIIESVPTRTRLGKAVLEPEGPTVPLPVLKPKTKTNRKLLAKKGELTGPGARPAKSGLNAKGNLLSGLNAVINDKGIQIKLKDSKQEEKARNLINMDRGFTFMNLSRAEVNRMIKEMSKEVTKILNKIKFDSL